MSGLSTMFPVKIILLSVVVGVLVNVELSWGHSVITHSQYHGESSSYPRSRMPTGSKPLYVVSTSNVTTADVVTVETLAGQIARETPEIYLVPTTPSATDSYANWLRDMKNNYNVTTNNEYLYNITGLIASMSSRIDGFVKFNPSTESVNAALTYCAAQSSVVIAAGSPMTVSLLSSLNIPLVEDLTSTSVSTVYNKFRTQFSFRMVSFQPPAKQTCLSEYAVFGRMPTLEYEGDTGGELATQVLKDISSAGVNGVAMGWGPEKSYVTTLAKYGVYVHASDYVEDLPALTSAVHTNLRVPRQPPSLRFNTITKGPMMTDTHTVTFLMTDGDNLQWLLGPWSTGPDWYGSQDRGKVPMGWTLSPALSVVAPAALASILSNQTNNDGFVAAPSGMGYTYPSVSLKVTIALPNP